MAVAEIKDVNDLASQLNSREYAQRGEGALRETASNEYKDLLKAQLGAAQNTYSSGYGAMRRQQENLQARYNKQYEIADAANQQASANAIARAKQRGMQYSRTNEALQRQVAQVGDKALGAITLQAESNNNAIQSQIDLLSQQLAENQAQANSEYNKNLVNRIQALKDSDSDRALQGTSEQNSLLTQLYKLQNSGGGGGGGGGSGYYGGYTKKKSSKPKSGNGGGDTTSLLDLLGGDHSNRTAVDMAKAAGGAAASIAAKKK